MPNKKVRVLQQILVNGEPQPVDSIIELPVGLANELIAQEVVVDYIEKVEPAPAPSKKSVEDDESE